MNHCHVETPVPLDKNDVANTENDTQHDVEAPIPLDGDDGAANAENDAEQGLLMSRIHLLWSLNTLALVLSTIGVQISFYLAWFDIIIAIMIVIVPIAACLILLPFIAFKIWSSSKQNKWRILAVLYIVILICAVVAVQGIVFGDMLQGSAGSRIILGYGASILGMVITEIYASIELCRARR